MVAELSASASASSTTQRPESSNQRRLQLQQQCLEPSWLGEQSHQEEAWLFLLGITEDHIQARISTLQKHKVQDGAEPQSSSSKADAVDEAEVSSIPLDKDGWQVANPDILTADGDSWGGSLAADSDGWKVVKSKKTRRHRGDETASTTSAPNSPDLNESKQSSGTEESSVSSARLPSSPNPHGESEAPPKAEACSDQQNPTAPSASQPRYPNLSDRDIEQVAKDVERSFIGPAFKHRFLSSPADEDASKPSAAREQRRAQLSHLILTTLSRFPGLHYFQGYHDILTVVLLSLSPQVPPSDREQAVLELAAERISLHVIRDSMTRDLLPVMGQLKVLGNLLRACDPALAELADRASPLPFFALPWLLTLLTHDAMSVAVMQRVVVFVLAYGPASAIYLCAALLEAKADELESMEEEEREDAAMLHCVLARLPVLQEEGKEDGGVEESAIYSDPDVELPSLAADRRASSGAAVSQVLQRTVELMQRCPLSTLQADTIMGPRSVLFTWSPLCTQTDWESAAAAASTALTGPTDAVVRDPHPPQPHVDDADEKHAPIPAAKATVDQTKMLAILGVSGLLVAALFTASQSQRVSADEGRKVLALVVSLLSSWGRVVGSQ